MSPSKKCRSTGLFPLCSLFISLWSVLFLLCFFSFFFFALVFILCFFVCFFSAFFYTFAIGNVADLHGRFATCPNINSQHVQTNEKKKPQRAKQHYDRSSGMFLTIQWFHAVIEKQSHKTKKQEKQPSATCQCDKNANSNLQIKRSSPLSCHYSMSLLAQVANPRAIASFPSFFFTKRISSFVSASKFHSNSARKK